MKRIATILIILIFMAIPATAYAQAAREPEVYSTDAPAATGSAPDDGRNAPAATSSAPDDGRNAPAATGSAPDDGRNTQIPAAVTEIIDVSEQYDDTYENAAPRLADGEPGRGTIDDPDKYWVMNGYPEYISYAYNAGGELRDDGTSISYWEIGLVNADETIKKAILDLVSPNCRVTFWNCNYSYNQREKAFNEIYASRNDIVRDVAMLLNSEAVFVEIAEGYEKEYARKFIEQYGTFVVVTNSISSINNAMTGGGSMGIDAGLTPGGPPGTGFDSWLLPLCIIIVVLIAAVVYINRNRLIPALQTNTGATVAQNPGLSRKHTVAAVKNSAVSPSNDVLKSIMRKIDEI